MLTCTACLNLGTSSCVPPRGLWPGPRLPGPRLPGPRLPGLESGLLRHRGLVLQTQPTRTSGSQACLPVPPLLDYKDDEECIGDSFVNAACFRAAPVSNGNVRKSCLRSAQVVQKFQFQLRSGVPPLLGTIASPTVFATELCPTHATSGVETESLDGLTKHDELALTQDGDDLLEQLKVPATGGSSVEGGAPVAAALSRVLGSCLANDYK
eukprot:gene16003-22139_t